MAADAGTNAQLQAMQQTLDQLLQLVSAQRAEQQVLKSEVSQLKSEITRMQSPATVQPSWIAQMESTLAVYFDRQLKKMDEINSPAKTQQVTRRWPRVFSYLFQLIFPITRLDCKQVADDDSIRI